MTPLTEKVKNTPIDEHKHFVDLIDNKKGMAIAKLALQSKNLMGLVNVVLEYCTSQEEAIGMIMLIEGAINNGIALPVLLHDAEELEKTNPPLGRIPEGKEDELVKGLNEKCLIKGSVRNILNHAVVEDFSIEEYCVLLFNVLQRVHSSC